MAATRKAGQSAREQAEKYQRLADNWAKGAAGEERTAEVLATLSQRGYYVLHDLRVPGSRANIDHLVLGPTGVFMVDSKQFSGRLSVNKGTLWCGRYPQTNKLDTTRWEADQVAAALEVGVHAVQCIHGTAVPVADGPVRGVHLCDGDGLLAFVGQQPVVLQLADYARLTNRATTMLLGPAPGVAPVSAPPRPAARRAPSPPAARRPDAKHARQEPVGILARIGLVLLDEVARLAILAVVCVAAVLLVMWGVQQWTAGLSRLGTTTTTTTAPAP